MIEVDDLDARVLIVDTFEPPPLTLAQRAGLAIALIRACGLVAPPQAAGAELRLRGRGTRSRGTDARSATTTTSATSSSRCSSTLDDVQLCVLGGRGETLEEAQEAKLELVCKKLG